MLILGAVAIVLPIVLYPVSHTLWQAVDLAMHPPDPRDPATPPAAPLTSAYGGVEATPVGTQRERGATR